MEEAKLNRLIKDCELSRLMHDLLGTYVTMEEYFMRESIHKVCFFKTRGLLPGQKLFFC